jgi:hypothetical protein
VTLGGLTFKGTRAEYDNDNIPDIYSRVQQQKRRIHIEAPNWSDCIKYNENIILFLKEMVMWFGVREFEGEPGVITTAKRGRPEEKKNAPIILTVTNASSTAFPSWKGGSV